MSGAFDQLSYDTLAVRLVNGHGFTFATNWYPFTEANQPTAHWSYLYTVYLAGVYSIVGHAPLVARVLQVLLSTLSGVLLWRLASRLFDPVVGLASAALWAVYAYAVFFDAALMTQSYYVLCLLGVMNCAVELVLDPRRRWWLLLGGALGCAALLRQTVLVFMPVLGGALVWAGLRRSEWRRAWVAGGMVALCVLPWTWFNYRTFGDFLLLNSNGGYFLYASNHPAQGVSFNPTFVAPVDESLRQRSEPARDRALYRAALGFAATDPVRLVRLSISRIPDYFWVLPSSGSSRVSNLARLLSFTLYLPLFVHGLYLSRRRWRLVLPLYAYVAFDTALHLMSWAAPRYRLPSDVLLMAVAGLSVTVLVGRVRGPQASSLSPHA